MANMSLKPNSRGDLLSCSPPTTHTHTHLLHARWLRVQKSIRSPQEQREFIPADPSSPSSGLSTGGLRFPFCLITSALIYFSPLHIHSNFIRRAGGEGEREIGHAEYLELHESPELL